MTNGYDDLVLVAGELRDLSGPVPEWPGGLETLFNAPGAPLPRREDVVAAIPLVSHSVGEAVLAGLPGLRVVANYGVGYDNIDLGAAAARRGRVTHGRACHGELSSSSGSSSGSSGTSGSASSTMASGSSRSWSSISGSSKGGTSKAPLPMRIGPSWKPARCRSSIQSSAISYASV